MRARDREAGIRAAMDFFYAGPIAQQAVKFAQDNAFLDASGQRNSGLLVLEDWVEYGGRGTQVEEPAGVTYRGIEVLKCGPWTQGPVFLQQLKLLEGFDLAGLGHATPAS